ncbi:hypothetical protein PXW75_25195 [Klebsiella pneumoniae]|nr:hypothetical protein [Klebsiella pneumoniae]MDE4847729.1 hypothetical protein [Klebsiella pneumoniae]HBQ5785138.1 hypothetical protein [Klebsiella pneumoniae subsp. pneumoniae]
MNNKKDNLFDHVNDNNLKIKNTSCTTNLRHNCVSVRFNNEELKILNIKRGKRSKAEWLRLIALEKMPPTVPSINNETWKALSVVSQQLNRIVLHLDTKSCNSALTKTEIFAIQKNIEQLRTCLITSKNFR